MTDRTRILIIGGYGNFGSFIARYLSQESDIDIIIAGRSADKARSFAQSLNAGWTALNIKEELDSCFKTIRPVIVIHASGPYQKQGYRVAETCIRHGCHYIDLADARDFVANIGRLDGAAKKAGVLVVSGASSVPALTSAIIDSHIGEFKTLERVDYGIATAQRTNRGLATASAVLGYAGKPFETMIDGTMRTVYGWQNLHFRNFPGLGRRALGNCDVPDLALFPQRYHSLKTIRFYAGLEVPAVHVGLWLLTWMVRLVPAVSLTGSAPLLLRISRLFDRFGSDCSGFYMDITGIDPDGKPKTVTFNLTARSGHGPWIPCMPAILTALKLARGEIDARGATPCMGIVSLDNLLNALKSMDIKWSLTPPP